MTNVIQARINNAAVSVPRTISEVRSECVRSTDAKTAFVLVISGILFTARAFYTYAALYEQKLWIGGNKASSVSFSEADANALAAAR
jgi:hypothetical protein